MKKGRIMLLTNIINANVNNSIVGNGGVNGGVIDGCSARPEDLVERFSENAASKPKRMRPAGRTMLAGITAKTATAAGWLHLSLQRLHQSLCYQLSVCSTPSPFQPASFTQSQITGLCGSQL